MTMSRQQLERTKRSLTPTKAEHPEVAQPLNVVHFATGKEYVGKYGSPDPGVGGVNAGMPVVMGLTGVLQGSA